MNSESTDSSQPRVKELFIACMQENDEDGRESLLRSEEPALAAEVRSLLASIKRGEVLDQVFELEASIDRSSGFVDSEEDDAASYGFDLGISEGPGTQIGNYKLLEQIGEGGMGTVFMAQQTAPVKRKVAVKIVKPGMDSRQVVARFEAERQALALMDHPNIARVFDGGTTDLGRPYFVMELVNGIPLSDFCQRRKLSLRQRLELFTEVCAGVQHAHQRGVIHRDLKPSNVLVTLHDDKPVIKIIDFGIAKATSVELTDKTLFTQFASLIGTPLYMSPEQAELSGLDVDTRSDVYSLGVMLYELLTGTTPFDRETLKQRGLDEIRRMIRETDPPRPSQRISSVKSRGGDTDGSSQLREIKRSKSLLKGELDWIVMRSIEKDRTRRYQSASDLGADIKRYLAGDTVAACPPSISYQLQKSVRRNKVLFLSTSAVVLTALLGACVSLIYARNASESAKQALIEQGKAQRSAVDARDNFDLSVEAIDQLVTRVADKQLRESPQAAPVVRSVFEDIVGFYDKLIEQSDRVDLRLKRASARINLATITKDIGSAENERKSWALFAKTISELESLLAQDPQNQVIAGLLTEALMIRAYDDGPLKLFERVVEVAEATGLPSSDSLLWRSHYATSLKSVAEATLSPEEALPVLRKAKAVMLPDWRPQDDRFTPAYDIAIGQCLLRLGRIEEGIASLVDGAQSDWARAEKYGTRHFRFLAMLSTGTAAAELVPHDQSKAIEMADEFLKRGNTLVTDFPFTSRFTRLFYIRTSEVLSAVAFSLDEKAVSQWLRLFHSRCPPHFTIVFRLRNAYATDDQSGVRQLIRELCEMRSSFASAEIGWLYHRAAETAVRFQDRETYRKLLDAFPVADDDGNSMPPDRDWVQTLCLMPNAPEDFAPAIEAFERYQRAGIQLTEAERIDLAFLYFRSGENQRAIETLSEDDAGQERSRIPIYKMYLRSMILAAMDRQAEAESWLKQATAAAEVEFVGTDRNSRNRHVKRDLLRKEAERSIR